MADASLCGAKQEEQSIYVVTTPDESDSELCMTHSQGYFWNIDDAVVAAIQIAEGKLPGVFGDEGSARVGPFGKMARFNIIQVRPGAALACTMATPFHGMVAFVRIDSAGVVCARYRCTECGGTGLKRRTCGTTGRVTTVCDTGCLLLLERKAADHTSTASITSAVSADVVRTPLCTKRKHEPGASENEPRVESTVAADACDTPSVETRIDEPFTMPSFQMDDIGGSTHETALLTGASASLDVPSTHIKSDVNRAMLLIPAEAHLYLLPAADQHALLPVANAQYALHVAANPRLLPVHMEARSAQQTLFTSDEDAPILENNTASFVHPQPGRRVAAPSLTIVGKRVDVSVKTATTLTCPDLTKDQIAILEAAYGKNASPDESLYIILAHTARVGVNNVKRWFFMKRQTQPTTITFEPNADAKTEAASAPPKDTTLHSVKISTALSDRLKVAAADFPTDQNSALISSTDVLLQMVWNEISTKPRSLALPALAFALLAPSTSPVKALIDNSTPTQCARLWYLVGLALVVGFKTAPENELILALEACHVALRFAPDLVDGFRLRSFIYAGMGQLTASLADRQTVVQKTQPTEDRALRCNDIISMGELMIRLHSFNEALTTLHAAKLVAGSIVPRYWIRANQLHSVAQAALATRANKLATGSKPATSVTAAGGTVDVSDTVTSSMTTASAAPAIMSDHGTYVLIEPFSCAEEKCGCVRLIESLPIPNCLNCFHPIERHPPLPSSIAIHAVARVT